MNPNTMNKRSTRRTVLFYRSMLGFAALLLCGIFIYLSGTSSSQHKSSSSAPATTSQSVLKVLSYSSFTAAWGPGPEILENFKKRYGIEVLLQDGGEAGILTKKLDVTPADVVIGLDQFSVIAARELRSWKKLEAFDQAPLTFIFRQGEVSPPTSLDDLLSPRFYQRISLQDPRTSSPGLMFLFWVLEQKGEEAGFEFIKKLKNSTYAVSPSWSIAYGLFQARQASLVFSYLTSPVYHWEHEKDYKYQPAVFAEGHPVQVEYVGVPASCKECDWAEKFVEFLLEPESQKIIMNKNTMLPIRKETIRGSLFEKLPSVNQMSAFRHLDEWVRRRDELLRRWQQNQ